MVLSQQLLAIFQSFLCIFSIGKHIFTLGGVTCVEVCDLLQVAMGVLTIEESNWRDFGMKLLVSMDEPDTLLFSVYKREMCEVNVKNSTCIVYASYLDWGSCSNTSTLFIRSSCPGNWWGTKWFWKIWEELWKEPPILHRWAWYYTVIAL